MCSHLNRSLSRRTCKSVDLIVALALQAPRLWPSSSPEEPRQTFCQPRASRRICWPHPFCRSCVCARCTCCTPARCALPLRTCACCACWCWDYVEAYEEVRPLEEVPAALGLSRFWVHGCEAGHRQHWGHVGVQTVPTGQRNKRQSRCDLCSQGCRRGVRGSQVMQAASLSADLLHPHTGVAAPCAYS